MIDIKFCKKCCAAFDIGTNFELCPDCRNELNEVKKEEDGDTKTITKS